MGRIVLSFMLALGLITTAAGSSRVTVTPRATLIPASMMRLPGAVDSNSPAMWELDRGQMQLHVVTSWAGQASVSSGGSLETLSAAQPSVFDTRPAGGYWIEAIVSDVDGTWYGYYHNERLAENVCPGTNLMIPRIGAAISRDRGVTWQNLGIILHAPFGSQACNTTNEYFAGGVGDFSVVLDRNTRYAYIFYSAYPRQPEFEGVSAARFLWADRDAPVGKLSVWRDDVWLPEPSGSPSSRDDTTRTPRSFSGTPIFPVRQPWHGTNTKVDAFWGPAVHWNTYLEQYVMLLNRAKNSSFDSEGIYMSFAADLDDPRLWSAPAKLLNGGQWYPQVIGTMPGSGTDTLAGETARFFMSGKSSFLIRFWR